MPLIIYGRLPHHFQNRAGAIQGEVLFTTEEKQGAPLFPIVRILCELSEALLSFFADCQNQDPEPRDAEISAVSSILPIPPISLELAQETLGCHAPSGHISVTRGRLAHEPLAVDLSKILRAKLAGLLASPE